MTDKNSNSQDARDPIYVILHLPKTGGTSLNFYLTRYLGADELLLLYDDTITESQSIEGTFNYLHALPEQRKRSLKVIIGHNVYFDFSPFFSRPLRYITFFREPGDRAISTYNFLLSKYYLSGDNRGMLFTHNNTLLNILDFSSRISRRNEIFHYLVDHGFGESSYGENSKRLTMEIEQILSKFYYIGLTENLIYEQSFWFNQFGFVPKFLVKINKSRRFIDSKKNPELLAQLQNVNNLDLVLYQEVKRINKVFLKNNPTYIRERERLYRYVQHRLVFFWPICLLYNIHDWSMNHFLWYQKLFTRYLRFKKFVRKASKVT